MCSHCRVILSVGPLADPLGTGDGLGVGGGAGDRALEGGICLVHLKVFEKWAEDFVEREPELGFNQVEAAPLAGPTMHAEQGIMVFLLAGLQFGAIREDLHGADFANVRQQGF